MRQMYHMSMSPGAQELDPAAVALLLEEAIGRGSSAMVRFLCWTAPARHIAAASLARLLELAMPASSGGEGGGGESGGEDGGGDEAAAARACLHFLCELGSVQQLERPLLLRLLRGALGLADTSALCCLCQLWAARQLPADAVGELLWAALGLQRPVSGSNATASVPAAEEVAGEAPAAVGGAAAVSVLAQLPGARRLPLPELRQLMAAVGGLRDAALRRDVRRELHALVAARAHA